MLKSLLPFHASYPIGACTCTPSLLAIKDSLETLANAIQNGFADDRSLQDIWGWSYPDLNRHDIANIPRQLANRLVQADPENIDRLQENVSATLNDIPRRLDKLKTNTVPYLYNGNGATAFLLIEATVAGIEKILEPLLAPYDFEKIPQDYLPRKLSKRIKSFKAELELIAPELTSIQQKIKTINDAHDAAESLPTDMQALSEMKEAWREATVSAQTIMDKAVSLNSLIDKLDKALRDANKQALAGAFKNQADLLEKKQRRWTYAFIGFVMLLLIIAGCGLWKLQFGNFYALGIKFLAGLPIEAPLIWLAWYCAKQAGIQQKLYADYAYKAATALSFEGYKKETESLENTQLKERLLETAIKNFGDNPLRLLEKHEVAHPVESLLDMLKDKDPTLVDKVLELFRLSKTN